MKEPGKLPPPTKKNSPDNQIVIALSILLISLIGVCAISLFLYYWFSGAKLF